MTGSDSSESAETTDRPPLRLIRGDASAEEIAALVAVLSAAGGGEPEDEVGDGIPSQWAAPAARMRPPVFPGPGGWRASALPR